MSMLIDSHRFAVAGAAASVVSHSVDTELAATITVDYPSSMVVGNTLVLVSGRSNTSVSTAPSGFTEREDQSNQFCSQTVWTRVIDGSESGSATIIFSTTRQQVAYMVQVNGTYDASAATGGTGDASTYVLDGVTAATAGLLLSFVTAKDTSDPLTVFTAPAGMTLGAQDDDGSQQVSAFAWEVVASGATGTRTWSLINGGSLKACNIVLSDL